MLLLKVFLSTLLLVGVVIDANKVRFGSISAFSEQRKDPVAVVNSKTVYESIPEHQTIVKEGIQKGTARYAKLMQVCTTKYKIALPKASRNKYVLVIEVGGISGYPTTDITNSVISMLPYIKYDEES